MSDQPAGTSAAAPGASPSVPPGGAAPGQPAAAAPPRTGPTSFDLSNFELYDDEREALYALGGKVQASQTDLETYYRAYKEHPEIAARDVEIRAEVDAMDRKHAQEALETLRADWGASFGDNFRLIREYLRGLPAKDREEIERKVLPDGRHSMHDPATLRGLAQQARSNLLPSDGKARELEIADIERDMRENRTAYFRDAGKQARYRELLRARG